MPLQNIAAIAGLINGSESFELPGFLIDIETFEPLLFGVNPTTQRRVKEAVIEDHIIPGRHSPLQEPVAGGAETITLDLLFQGHSELAMAATKQAVHWLESLFFPDRGGALGAISAALDGNFDRSQNFVARVGHRVSFTDGLWIIERPFRVRRLEVESGPGHHPFVRLPYRAMCRLTMQEDEQENIDYVTRRWGIPSI